MMIQEIVRFNKGGNYCFTENCLLATLLNLFKIIFGQPAASATPTLSLP
jgi:hypothetical protein